MLGDTEQARAHTALADDVAASTWARWREHALTTQTGCAVALELGIAPAEAEAEVGRRWPAWSGTRAGGSPPDSSARRWCCRR